MKNTMHSAADHVRQAIEANKNADRNKFKKGDHVVVNKNSKFHAGRAGYFMFYANDTSDDAILSDTLNEYESNLFAVPAECVSRPSPSATYCAAFDAAWKAYVKVNPLLAGNPEALEDFEAGWNAALSFAKTIKNDIVQARREADYEY